jgi:hypothetical protein
MTDAPILTDKRIEHVPELTADWARILLDNPGSENNRKVYPTRVRRYRGIILEGRWKRNGETFKIRTDGSVGDGRHRLLALIEADSIVREVKDEDLKDPNLSDAQRAVLASALRMRHFLLTHYGHTTLSIPADVMWGATDEDILAVDTGKPRSIADVMWLEGHKWPRIIGAAVTMLDTYERGTWKDPYARSDNEALSELRDMNPGLESWLEKGDAVHRRTKFHRTASIVGLYIIDREHGNSTRVHDFADRLISGEDLRHGHPILALRNYAIGGSWRVSGNSRMTQKKALIAIIKAFNYAARDKELKLMKVLWNEEVPKVVRDK